jgi:hypothetical protein
MHNPGEACLDCHVAGNASEAPPFVVGGTLFTSIKGSTPVVGATIVLVDATGATLSLVSAQNGNFWTSTSLTFPIRVTASSCPNAVAMLNAQQVGNCNTTGCHGSNSQIHLP